MLDIDQHAVLHTSEHRIERYGLSEICRGEDRAARLHVETQDCVQLLLELLENSLHDEGVAHVVRHHRHIILVDREILAEAELELISHQGHRTTGDGACLRPHILVSIERHHNASG